jgi:hypothetical protein
MKLEAKLEAKLERRSVSRLIRVACVLALIGLVIMVFSIVVPKPLPVIFAMSVGQVFGMAAVLVYFLAILVDLARKGPAVSVPPPPPRSSEADPD